MEISVDTLLKAVLRDRVFYRRSGGGVTLSGGEPLMQPDFTAAFLRALHEAGSTPAWKQAALPRRPCWQR